MTPTLTTTSRRCTSRAALLALTLAATAAGAHHLDGAAHAPTTKGTALHADHAWARATPPNAKVAAGYLVLRNDGATDDRLVSATSPDAERVELHEMKMANGTMQMRAMTDGVPVKAGASMEFRPGGSHLMFINPKRPFKAGDTVSVTLTYARAPAQTLRLPVQPIGSAGPAADAGTEHAGHAH